MSLDTITLTGLAATGHHGVLPEERRDGQPFSVDLALRLDTRAAAAGDDLAMSVDYSVVAAEVIAVIEGEPVDLIETLAARVAQVVLAHEAVVSVDLTVHKPQAPLGVPFDDVTITLTRGRDEATHVAESVAAEPDAALATAEPDAALAAAGAVGVTGLVGDPDRDPDPEPEPEPAQQPAADLDEPPVEPAEVVLALGGNVGDVRATLRQTIDELAATEGIEVLGVAPLAKTAAVLQPDAVAQPDFLNTVVLVRSAGSPRWLLDRLRQLEQAHGRERRVRWGERTLDIDIVLFDSVTSEDPELSLPHPLANERAFVLVPWSHLEPDAFLPGLDGGPVAELAETAQDREGVRWLALDWYELPDAGGPVREPEPNAPAAAVAPLPPEEMAPPAAAPDRTAVPAIAPSGAQPPVPAADPADGDGAHEPEAHEPEVPEPEVPEPEVPEPEVPEPVVQDGVVPEPVVQEPEAHQATVRTEAPAPDVVGDSAAPSPVRDDVAVDREVEESPGAEQPEATPAVGAEPGTAPPVEPSPVIEPPAAADAPVPDEQESTAPAAVLPSTDAFEDSEQEVRPEHRAFARPEQVSQPEEPDAPAAPTPQPAVPRDWPQAVSADGAPDQTRRAPRVRPRWEPIRRPDGDG